MKDTAAIDVRRLVWQLLQGGHDFPTRKLDQALAEEKIDPRDRALAKELLTGILRVQSTLNCIACAYASRRIKDLRLQVALQLGLYQLLYLDRIPHHAAIDATLNAVKPELAPKVGFLNAVLRTVGRNAAKLPSSGAPARNVLPEPSWKFERNVFKNPTQDPAAFLAETRGYPNFLIRRWWDRMGEECARNRAQALNRKASLWLRVNPLRCNSAEAQSGLESQGIEISAEEHPGMLQVLSSPADMPISAWPGFVEGFWSVQDLTSFQSLALAQPEAGEKILDICAAPGGKCFAAYELAGGEAEILACDVSAVRLQILRQEAQRLGHSIQTLCLDSSGKNLPPGAWDLLLCDVPCSNTGVLNKRPEARSRFSKEALHQIETLQNLIRKKLILPSLQAESRILWTTCSLEEEENQQAAQRLAKASGRDLGRERHFEPSALRAGGYAALVEPQTTA